MTTSEIREITGMYDYLIDISSKKIGKKIKMEWGSWYPSVRGLDRLMSRRDRLKRGIFLNNIKREKA